MPTYKFEALNTSGEEVKDSVDAPSEEEASQKIKAMGYFVTKLTASQKDGKKGKKAKKTGKSRKTFVMGGVSQKKLTLFTRQFSVLQDAGLPVLRSLRILEKQMKPGALKNSLIDVVEDVESGMTLSEALAKHPKCFDRLYVNMVRAGEAGGALEIILQRLADFKEKAQGLKRKIIGAMVYPAVVIFVAVAILTFIMVMIIPKFKKIFDEFGLQLPWATQTLIKISTWVKDYWAAKSCPAQAYMRDVLANTFSLSHNSELTAVERVNASTEVRADPANRFAQSPPTEAAPREDIITRLEAAQVVANVEGGAGSSLTSEQKRTLHVHSQTTTRDDGLLEACVQIIKPIGSTFRFLCDTKGVRAPAPLAYLSAGVGFCFMTQAGRYATIVKQDLQAYRIVQDNAFIVEDGQARALPVNTHLFVEMGEPAEAAQKLLSMSEQTCFLHAAMRTACPSEVTVRLDDQDVQRV